MLRKIFKIFVVLSLFSRAAAALAVPSTQLGKLIDSIQREENEYQSQVLKHQLDGNPIDKDSLPLKDPVTGAINIEGETPRDKLVTELVRKIDLVSEKVREAQSIQDELFAKMRTSSGSVAEVVVDLLATSGNKKFTPIKFDIYDNDLKLNTFESLLTRTNNESVTLIRTVFETGKKTIRVSGYFAATASAEEPFFSNRERVFIDQNIDLEVKGKKIRFLYRVVEQDKMHYLEPVRD